MRIVYATNKKLEEEVSKKAFREDLFYRLNVVRIHLPPLRARQDDIRLLAEYFLQKIAITSIVRCLSFRKKRRGCWKVILAGKCAGTGKYDSTGLRAGCNGRFAAEGLHSGRVSTGTVEATSTRSASVEAVVFLRGQRRCQHRVAPLAGAQFTLRALQKTSNNQVRASKMLGITRATLRKRLERNGALGGSDGE